MLNVKMCMLFLTDVNTQELLCPVSSVPLPLMIHNLWFYLRVPLGQELAEPFGVSL